MQHELSAEDMDDLLRSQLYGHLGCTTPDGRIYVVPITYAYYDGYVYSFSSSGMKVDAMRAHPSVCFQAEQFLEDGFWRSVVAWGTFEELSGTDRVEAMSLIFRRFELQKTTIISPLFHDPAEVLAPMKEHMKKKDAVLYRIRITERTGKSSRYV